MVNFYHLQFYFWNKWPSDKFLARNIQLYSDSNQNPALQNIKHIFYTHIFQELYEPENNNPPIQWFISPVPLSLPIGQLIIETTTFTWKVWNIRNILGLNYCHLVLWCNNSGREYHIYKLRYVHTPLHLHYSELQCSNFCLCTDYITALQGSELEVQCVALSCCWLLSIYC